MSNSKTFSIQGKNLKANTAEDLEPYLSELKGMDDVEEVVLGGNSLGVEACQAIAEVLKGKKNLKVVNLSDIFTGRLISEIPQALSALCDALQTHTSLIELDLSDNAFGGRCADAMVPFLSNNTHFQTFRLTNNGLGIAGGQILSAALLSNAETCAKEGKKSSIRRIVCGRNRLENGSASHWAEAFKALGGLVEVRMPQNGIRMEGVKAIAKGLSNNINLEILDLQDNTMTKSGTRSLVKVLPKWPNLKELNLSDCLLGKVGGIALATALGAGSNPKLETLKLAFGEFDKRTVEILAVGVAQHMKVLKSVDLCGNKVLEDDESIEELRKALALHGNDEALEELEDMEDPEDDDEDDEEDTSEEEEEDDEEDKVEKDDGVDAGVSDSGKMPAADDKATDDLADLLAGVHVATK